MTSYKVDTLTNLSQEMYGVECYPQLFMQTFNFGNFSGYLCFHYMCISLLNNIVYHVYRITHKRARLWFQTDWKAHIRTIYWLKLLFWTKQWQVLFVLFSVAMGFETWTSIKKNNYRHKLGVWEIVSTETI